MASLDAVVERAAAIGAGVCVAAFGGTGIAQSVGGAAVAAIGLAALVHGAMRQCGPDCEKRVKKLTEQVKQRLIQDDPAFATDYEDAASRLSVHLAAICPGPARIAALSVEEGRFAGAATAAVLADLRERGAGLDEPRYARLATAVLEATFDLAFKDHDYFQKQLAPELLREIARLQGAIKDDTETIRKTQEADSAKIDAILTIVSGGDSGALKAARATVEVLQAEGEVKNRAIAGFLEDFGESALSPEMLAGQLTAFAQQFRALLAKARTGSNLPAELEAERAKVREALEAGDLAEADRRLRRLDDRIELWIAEHVDTVDQMRRDRAKVLMERGDIALARLDNASAAEIYAMTAAALPDDALLERWQAHMMQAAALTNLAELGLGENAGARAIDILRHHALPIAQRLTLEGVAITLGRLGIALSSDNENEASIREAIGAFEAALQVSEPGSVTWTSARNNLSAALQRLSAFGDEDAHRRAIQGYRTLLQGVDKNAQPDVWATIQMNLGTALCAGDDEASVREGVAAMRAALTVAAPEHELAVREVNLGNALTKLAHFGDAEGFEEGIAVMRRSISRMSEEEHPFPWALAQNNLGNALRLRATVTNDPQNYAAALAALAAAARVRTRARMPLAYAFLQGNLGLLYETRGDAGGGAPDWRLAQGCIAEALEIFQQQGMAPHIRTASYQLARLQAKLKPN
jgi:tetratricopeptide (TPR) repeat protein